MGKDGIREDGVISCTTGNTSFVADNNKNEVNENAKLCKFKIRLLTGQILSYMKEYIDKGSIFVIFK